jgi:TP901 family phage tail tape measure protein
MASNQVLIHVKAKDDASKEINKATSSVSKLGKAAGLAFAAAGVGAAGFAVAALKMAVGFESAMSEVKTLLPTLDDKTFERLGDDLRAMSSEMGIATSEAIPALYSAISAGIPPDNVIDFMTIAAKAAIGGVTSLETAVDGISTVVNSYGDDVISATQASDIMFSAVKDGKTTFEELSSSLATVLPIASSLGVSFEEVASSVATMTAMGMKTTTATAGLRGMFVEATRTGTELDKAIREIAGDSMGVLIASGDTAAGVLQQVRESMPDQEFRDLFGSVEASAAALMLTGANAEAFANNLDNARESAGALDGAFATVADTAQFKMDKALGTLKNMMLDLGLKILPLAVIAFERLHEVISLRLVPWVRDELVPVLSSLYDSFRENVLPVIEDIIPVVREFAEDALGALVTTVEHDVIPKLETLASIINKYVFPALTALAAVIRDHVVPIMKALIGFLRDNKEFIVGFGVAIAIPLVAAFYAWATAAIVAAKATLIALAPVIATPLAIALLVGSIIWAIRHWDEITAAMGRFADKVVGALTTALDWLRDKFFAFLDSQFVWLSLALGPLGLLLIIFKFRDQFISAFEAVGNRIGSIVDGIKKAIDAVISAFARMPGLGDIPGAGAVSATVGFLGGIGGWASGGIVRATPGGTIARIGEGGRDEAIIPLGAGGLAGMGSTTNNISINLSGVITDPVATGQAIADAINRASITTGPLVLAEAVRS